MHASRAARGRLALALQWRPEWWVAGIAAATWVAMLTGVGMGGMGARAATGAGMLMWCSAVGDHGTGIAVRHPSLLPLATASGCSTMVVAMMLPVALPAVRHVALNSMRHRRQLAISVYVLVYVGCWVLLGSAVLLVGGLLVDDWNVGNRLLLALALLIAAAWQLSRAKRRALFACGRTVPLPPSGWRANAGCARFALVQAQRCIVSCWALMVVTLAAGGVNIGWMCAVTALVLAEELTMAGRKLARPASVALAIAGVVVAVGA